MSKTVNIELDGKITPDKRDAVIAVVGLMVAIEALRAFQRVTLRMNTYEKDRTFEKVFMVMSMSTAIIACAKRINELNRKSLVNDDMFDEVAPYRDTGDIELNEITSLYQACIKDKYEEQPMLQIIYKIRNKYSSHYDHDVIESFVNELCSSPGDYRIVATMEDPSTIGTTCYRWGREFFKRSFGSKKSPQFDRHEFEMVIKIATTMDRLAASLLAGVVKRKTLPFRLISSCE